MHHTLPHTQPPSPSPTPIPPPTQAPQPHPTTTTTTTTTYPTGSQVEVTHKEGGLGGWFIATVTDPPAFLFQPSSHHQPQNRVFVEYKHLLNRNGSGPLRGFVDVSKVRPQPPPFHLYDSLKENDIVDAFFDDGWWAGIVNRIVVCAGGVKQYQVFFNDPPRWMQVPHSHLRVHMFWIDGKWFLSSNGSLRVNDLNPYNHLKPNSHLLNPSNNHLNPNINHLNPKTNNVNLLKQNNNHKLNKDSNKVIDLTDGDDLDIKNVSTNLVDLTGCDDSHLNESDDELNFTPGALVEVNLDSFNSKDVWILASFVKTNKNGLFTVEYHSPDVVGNAKAIVSHFHIRPAPPPSNRKRFNLLEKVDAFNNNRWLSGVVTQILPEERYIVYCKSTKKEMEVHHKDVRPHVEWAPRKWVPPPSSSQDCLPSSSPEKSDHGCGNGYKDVHVLPELNGITKDNVGCPTLCPITLRNWQALLQNSAIQNVNSDGAMPSNETSKGTSVDGDSAYLKENIVTDETETSEHCTTNLEQLEVPDEKALIAVDSVITSDSPKSTSQQSDSEGNKDNRTRSPSRRKRGRPRKYAFAFETEFVNEKPNENVGVSPKMQICRRRTFAKRRHKSLNEILDYKKDKDEQLRHSVMSGRQQRHYQQSDSLPPETASNRATETCDSGVAEDSGAVVTRIPANVSDDSSLCKPHYPSQTDGQCNETEEKPLIDKLSPMKSAETSCQDSNADNSPMKSNSNNKELPFVKNSPVWETIESMEVFKRFPQRPHFGPLYEYKEELREGLAIGNMITFSTLVDKISRIKLSDPRSIIDGYLESLVDLKRMGFDVKPVRDLLKSLLALKDKQEKTQKSYIEIEGHIMEQKFLKSIINKEITELEEKIEDLHQERALLVEKKHMKDSAIQLLHSGVDNIKMNLQHAEQEFAEVAASPW